MWEPRMLRVMVALALAFAGPAAAQEVTGEDGLASNGVLDVGQLCAQVESQFTEMNPRHPNILFRFESELADAAGVLPTDTEGQMNAKIGELINANAVKLTCNQANFNPRNGNIFKLAVAKQSTIFVNHVTGKWKVDLNRIDETDGKTVLDYIADLRSTAGSNYAVLLDRYYKRFRAAGAKHRSELER
jgi:hypothetical protein